MTCLSATFSPQTRGVLSSRAMTVFSTFAAATFLASAAAPTPLYHHYQQAFGLTPSMMTVVFAAYAISLLTALLFLGSLSDHVGRRPVIFAALVLNALAMMAFIEAHGAVSLIVARVVQGFATGMATTAAGAAILDTDRQRGPLLNSITAFVGLFFGALGSGILVTYAPQPARLVYLLLFLISATGAVLVWLMPETVEVVGNRRALLASLRPQIGLPAAARRTFAHISPVNVAGWALGGFNFSLMPSLVRATTGFASPLMGAVVVANLMIAAAIAVIAMRRHSSEIALTVGAASLAGGMVVTLAAAHAGIAPLMLAGTGLAGFGFGASFSGALRELLPRAAAGERAGLLSTFYIESYLAFSLPTILAGLLVPMAGLEATSGLYGAIVSLLAVASLVAIRRAGRRRS